jgi:Flp pilus assembly protein TadG
MSQSRKGTLKGLNKDKRGAVLVEFAIAFMPLMITFSSFVQLQQMATARIALKHATIIGGRAASVISNRAKNTPDAEDNDGVPEIKKGVVAGLGPWKKRITVDVKVEDKSTCADPYGMVSVTVNADYNCTVPFANLFMCGASKTHSFKPMIARFPHQGARYQGQTGAKGCSTSKGAVPAFDPVDSE